MRQYQGVRVERADIGVIVVHIVDRGTFVVRVRSGDCVEVRVNQTRVIVVLVIPGMNVLKRR